MDNQMDVYNKIKSYGDEAKADAEAFIQGLTKKYTKENPAPDDVIHKGLESILAKYETKNRIQPSAVSASSLSPKHATGLLGILTAIAAFATGAYPIGIAAAAVTILSQYPTDSYKQKPA
jgi:hypothetical protein